MNLLWAAADKPEVNAALASWCAARIFAAGEEFAPPYSTLGVFDGKELAGVVVYHNFHRGHGIIEMSAAADTPRWLSRPVLSAMFEYAFIDLGCQLVTTRVDPENKRLRRIFTAYGFSNIRLPRFRGRGKDEILYMLTDDAWRANGFNKELIDGQKERA